MTINTPSLFLLARSVVVEWGDWLAEQPEGPLERIGKKLYDKQEACAQYLAFEADELYREDEGFRRAARGSRGLEFLTAVLYFLAYENIRNSFPVVKRIRVFIPNKLQGFKYVAAEDSAFRGIH